MKKLWYQSKTMWGAIILVVGALYKIATGDVVNGATLIGLGLSIAGLRHAIQ